MDAYSVGLSGVNTAAVSTAITANNIANASTPDYKAKRVDQEELREGGTRPAALRESQEPAAPGASNVDLATEITNLIGQSGAYRANLKVIETQNELLGQALDLKA